MTGISFATPLAFLLMPLPLLALLLPAAPPTGGRPLDVPETIAARLDGAAGSGSRSLGAATRLVLPALVWLALVIALAGPRAVAPTTALPLSGRDIVLALDLSGSMDRKDFELDGRPVRRLDALKSVAAEFVRRRAGDRVGLVVFAERAFYAAAPSHDVEGVARVVEAATIGIAGRSTAIGEGLGLALKRLDASPARSRVVILLSDGANNAGSVGPSDVAGLARELGIRVHTIAMGRNELGDAESDSDAVDAATLRRIADLSGGTAFRVRTTGELEAVTRAIDTLEADGALAPARIVERDLWPWPAGAAFLLAVLAALGDGVTLPGFHRRAAPGPVRSAATAAAIRGRRA